MTTSSPGFPPPAPACAASQPPPARPRRGLLIGLVAALVLALAGATVWWTNRGQADPLAGRPRVTDAEAGLSYAVPEGWEHDAAKDEDLVDGFSSQMTRKGADGQGSVVMTGRAGQPVPRAGLARAADAAARSNAEFFYPDSHALVEDSRPTTVDGRPAHTVVLRITATDGTTAHLEMTVVTADDTRTAFLLGITSGAPQAPALRELDEITADAAVVPATD
ncbi:hypothetical protein [Streptomyces sp. NPDC018610]|jgi:hypothetical protein|uniref:hypothetical protein n=1 Tax=Streptomyces sp. NPDC018610 TaxID=3365049 RepID=UPI0037BDCE2E